MRSSLVKYIRILFVLLGFLFCLPFVTYAVISNNPAADTQIWVQINNEFVQQNGKFYQKLTSGIVDNQKNSSVYIAECVDTADDRVCTTGTVEGDNVLYQSDENLKKLQTQYGYIYQGIIDAHGKSVQNPVTTDANGNIPILFLESTIDYNAVRKFYSVNLIKGNIDTSKLPNLEKIHTGYQGGQQQAAFEIKVPTPVPTQIVVKGEAPPLPCNPETDPNHCEREPNDPYGRVFDAVSLEPIPNVKVTLFVQRSNGKFSMMSPKETVNAIINPFTTREDGKYVYLTPNGIYQLVLDLPGYTFPFTPSVLNPNYTKAYYELYYGPGFTDQNIVEINTVEHRDIPVVPKGEPYRAPVKLLGYMSELDKKKQIYEVSGRTSHPLTLVEILGKEINSSAITRTLTKVTADKWGFFNETIATSMLKPNEMIGMVKMTKVDLTQNEPKTVTQKQSLSSFLSGLFTIFPRSSSYAENQKPKTIQFTLANLNPLLNYLEGYAYDINGKVILNAKVTIYLTGSKKPYYETKTDEKGYFTITSQHLPQMNYSMVYTTPEGKTYATTQKAFLEQNIQTILTDKINVNKYLTQIAPFKVATQERSQFTNEPKNNTPAADNKEPVQTQNNNNIAIILFIAFLLFSVLVVGVIFYIKQKNNPPLRPS